MPELPVDPADYIPAIEQHRYFQITSLGREDLQRSEYYRANAEREQLAGAENLDGFLSSLDMVATVAPVDSVSLERTAQLINKSNQFNLTTRRRTTAEVAALLADPEWFTCTISLRDRFGDNGLISVLLARREDDALAIDTWLMSCRVLKRGVEALLHNYLCSWARRQGIGRIVGEYLPTAKNGLVKEQLTPTSASQPLETSAERAQGARSSSSRTTGRRMPCRSSSTTASRRTSPRFSPSRVPPTSANFRLPRQRSRA